MNNIIKFISALVIVIVTIIQCNAIDNDASSTGTSTSTSTGNATNTDTCINTDTCSARDNDTKEEQQQQQQQQQQQRYLFPGCRLYLAPTTSSSPTTPSGLGLFTTRSIKRGQPITFPDIIIQINDYLNANIGQLITEYSWDAAKFGGNLEGKSVASVLPGIGSLANGNTNFKKSNVIPYNQCDVDEANVPRTTSAGAGSFTHYHNLTFFASNDIYAGEELFIYHDKKDSFFDARIQRSENDSSNDIHNDFNNGSNEKKNQPQRSVEWITQNGICLDNIKAGKSKIKGAGRGAIATRFIPKGSIIAPIPLVVIPDRDSLLVKYPKKKNKKQQIKMQLLLNYCFGHTNSSVLFFPTSPIVNLINHAPTTIMSTTDDAEDVVGTVSTKQSKTANAKIQWSTSQFHKGKEWPQTLSIEDLKNQELHSSSYSSGLMMEYIAIRDIQPKEEILFDYGKAWTNAWSNHESTWQPPNNAKSYSPAYVMEDVAGLLRIEKEQVDNPYSSNIEISCFYQYSIFKENRNDGIVSSSSASKNTKSSGQVTTVKWQMDRKTFEFKNLRPFNVMSREKLQNGHWIYTVMMKNRPGLAKEEMIPKGEMHVVNVVPRGAIRFTDKMYSTDQHLPNAFRHEIGIPDDMFPEAWMDSI
jgi:hypothetical protein